MNRMAMGVAVALLAACAVGCAERFDAALSAGQVVPPTAVTASGSSNLDYDKDKNELRYKVKVDDIADATGADVRIGVEGKNGDTVLRLFAGKKDGVFSGELVKGTATGSGLIGALQGKTLEELAQAFRDGRAYVIVTTTKHPGGEVRGQVKKRGWYKAW